VFSAARGGDDPVVEVLVLAADPSQVGLYEDLVGSNLEVPFTGFDPVDTDQTGTFGLHIVSFLFRL
jgi:hypothetical protein